jgi:phage/plasmid primase-like uncharacterized protein
MPKPRLSRDSVYHALRERGLFPAILDSLTPAPPRPSRANRAGWRRRGCPLHGGSDSFAVNDIHGGWKCWSCNQTGDVFALWMQVHRCSFPEALRRIAEQYGLDGIEHRPPSPPSTTEMDRVLANYRAPETGGPRGAA